MTFEERARDNEDRASGLEGIGTTRFGAWPGIPHYWGDVVRQLLIGGGALIVLAAPLYGNDLKAEFRLEVLGALVAVSLAALTSPHSKLILFLNALFSGALAATYAAWGIREYDSISSAAFLLRLLIAIVFLLAFYFSLKTVRAFVLGTVGRRERIDEFESEEEKRRAERFERSGEEPASEI